jgi:hypothetical protein
MQSYHGKIFEEDIDNQPNFDPDLVKVKIKSQNHESELLQKLDDLTLKLRDKDKSLSLVQNE